jgi:predicted ABC-class ATPase
VESYIIRIYRGDHKHPRDLVGIVEEVGVKEKKAFTNLDELYDILKFIKEKPGRQKKKKIFLSDHYETERRNELRLTKEMPCTLICNKKNVKAETVNCSKKGIAIRVADKIPLPVGDTLKFRMKDNDLKAQVKWVDHKSDLTMTLAGLEIIDGKLDLRGMKVRRVLRVE